MSKLAQFTIGVVTLGSSWKGDDTVSYPFVGSEYGWLGVLADKGQLLEVVVLEHNQYTFVM